MIETRQVETSPGMVFDVSVAGDPAAPLVLMLHGYNVSRHLWDAQVPAIAAAGYFAVAPNQRGYSACARPDPADHDARAGTRSWSPRRDRSCSPTTQPSCAPAWRSPACRPR